MVMESSKPLVPTSQQTRAKGNNSTTVTRKPVTLWWSQPAEAGSEAKQIAMAKKAAHLNAFMTV